MSSLDTLYTELNKLTTPDIREGDTVELVDIDGLPADMIPHKHVEKPWTGKVWQIYPHSDGGLAITINWDIPCFCKGAYNARRFRVIRRPPDSGLIKTPNRLSF